MCVGGYTTPMNSQSFLVNCRDPLDDLEHPQKQALPSGEQNVGYLQQMVIADCHLGSYL